MTPSASLAESQAFCRQIVAQSRSSFRRSFDFLRSDAQVAMHALYAFARLTDDLADHPHGDPLQAVQFASDIHRWLALITEPEAVRFCELTGGYGQDQTFTSLAQSFDNIRMALQDMVVRFEVPRAYLHALVNGAEFDLAPGSQIEDIMQLQQYCYDVASSVGLACLKIWRGNLDACETAAIDCGFAFQLTNIVRDVAEDACRGRIYLPISDLQRFGCSRDRWLALEPDGEWRDLLRLYIATAHEHYDSAKVVKDHLPNDAARMFSLMWNSYRTLLGCVEANIDEVWKRRIRLPYLTKAKLYLSHAITPIYVK